MFLSGDGRALLQAPLAAFATELERIEIAPAPFAARQPEHSRAQQSLEAELADLRMALRGPKYSSREIDNLLKLHRVEREKLQDYAHSLDRWRNDGEWQTVDGTARKVPVGEPPSMPGVKAGADLPGEFADYFHGFIAFQTGLTNEARRIWEQLLVRPEGERHYRSTWAAYKLGQAGCDTEPERAIAYCQQVRALARKGFADSLGLAAASLGWEARANLNLGRFEAAVSLYLDQWKSGDDSAVESLALVAAKALAGNATALGAAAKDPKARRVFTAYLISRDRGNWDLPEKDASRVQKWLAAVESAGVKDVEAAEQLALAAYQTGQMEFAERWLKRARADSPVAQWLQAKLLMRAGKLDEAAALLARVTHALPPEPPEVEATPDRPLGRRLMVDTGNGLTVSSGHHALGELGALRLARREYAEALDALLRAGYWMDAAYVAERVLRLDELKTYVDRHWPAMEAAMKAQKTAEIPDHGLRERAALTEKIRYLLARRLTRSNRGSEAREYYPEEWRMPFDGLVKMLTEGWDESLPAGQRARALRDAATITRTNGMELLGTEVEPDWHVYKGDFEFGVTMADRTNQTQLIQPAADELHRLGDNGVYPERRFHYRYLAAWLAWDAAKLMPDNSDETARLLCLAGTWLKDRDPKAADMFYKAFVRRCRQTMLGQEADRKRWFPKVELE